MSVTAAASGFVVLLLSVQVVQGQHGWAVTYSPTEICAFKGSTVEMHCTYTYPSFFTRVIKELWFAKLNRFEPVDLRTDSEYSGRVQYSCDEKSCTLRIRDLRESDSAEYKFMFTTKQPHGSYTGSPGVTLTVSALQVQVSRSSSNRRELKCHSRCSPAGHLTYVWFKNGEKTSRVETSFYRGLFSHEDSISCAFKGHEDLSSPSVYAPKLPFVSVSPLGEIVEGTSVTLTCSSDANPAANYTWYKENEDPDLQPLGEEPQLVFRSIQSSDSGEYNCAAENELGRRTSGYISIDVTYAPKLPSVSVSPLGEIVEGTSVTLTCSSDANPAANYTWYKTNEDPDLQPLGEEPQLVFRSIQSSDSGEYNCTAENELGRRTSGYISIDVTYAPKLPSVSVSPPGEIVEGSAVTLTCSSDANPAANYTWYKINEDSPKARGQIFTITNFRPEHSGNYYCEAENNRGRHNSTIHLTVEAVSPLGNSAVMTNIIRLTLVAVMLILLLLLICLWIRKKKTLSSTTEPNEPMETVELESDPDYTNIWASDSVTAACSRRSE